MKNKTKIKVPEKEATLYYDDSVNLADLCERIEDSGFSTKVLKEESNVTDVLLEKRDEFIIDGMTCNSCTATINGVLGLGIDF